MDIAGIFENKNDGNLYWMDCLDDYEIKQAKYFVDSDKATAYHECIKSVLYDDMTGYVDAIQGEHRLADDELYVVCYCWTDCKHCMYQSVDFGITKQEIIENVKAQKYVEGASYFTMGQMFYTTRMIAEGKY